MALTNEPPHVEGRKEHVDIKLLPPLGGDPKEKVRFECLEEGCGDILMGKDVKLHALEKHGWVEIHVDNSALWGK